MCRTVFRSNLRRHSWKRSSRLFPSRSMTMTWYIFPSSVFSSPTKCKNGTKVFPRSLWISLLSQKSMICRCIFTAFSYIVEITKRSAFKSETLWCCENTRREAKREELSGAGVNSEEEEEEEEGNRSSEREWYRLLVGWLTGVKCCLDLLALDIRLIMQQITAKRQASWTENSRRCASLVTIIDTVLTATQEAADTLALFQPRWCLSLQVQSLNCAKNSSK